MKKLSYIKALAALAIASGLTACGDKFLETDVYNAVDSDTALNSVTNVSYAINGAYYEFFYYYFAGNYATSIGDIASDISYWNGDTSHFSNIYQFHPTDTDSYLSYIWYYGYKVAESSTRVIKGAEAITDLGDDEKAELGVYVAEAHALRAYCYLAMANTFCHQVKVAGNDFSAKPGLVLIDDPIESFQQVKRSTLGETYTEIVNDLKEALKGFDTYGDRGDMFYMNKAAALGLLARTYLYLEDYTNAADYAQQALDEAGISSLVTTDAGYAALYKGGASNTESFFALGIDPTNNWSANSCGTLWSTYSYGPSPWLESVMAEKDCRRAIWLPTGEFSKGGGVPIFNSGKFYYGGGNPANATNYLINAPEMFLIKAEAYANLGQITPAANALLTVAKRNPAITKVADLPADKAGLLSFIRDERARELFQEGHRLWDLRRWDVKANVYAKGYPAVEWYVTNYKISDLVYPIPVDEINTDFGVEQNEGWNSTFPSL